MRKTYLITLLLVVVSAATYAATVIDGRSVISALFGNAFFATEFNVGNKSATFLVDFANGNKQKVTITGTNLGVDFVNSTSGVGAVQLKILQGDGNDTINWSTDSTIKWPAGTAPTLSTTAADVDIVYCYYDGANYYCQSALDFS